MAPGRVAELVPDVLGSRGAQAPKAVRGRRGDAAPEGRDELQRHGMRRHADGHRFLPTRDEVVHVGGAGQHERERPRPEFLRQLRGGIGHFTRPPRQEPRAVEVDDHGVRDGPALGLEYLAERGGILGARAQPIDRFGGERDQLAVAQGLHGGFDLDLTGTHDLDHGREF
jgi:hypothetical protein